MIPIIFIDRRRRYRRAVRRSAAIVAVVSACGAALAVAVSSAATAPAVSAAATGGVPTGGTPTLAAPAEPGVATVPGAPNANTPAQSSACLASGDGYLRAHLAGAIDANIDWPNSGTHCEGEYRDKPPGVRLSFQRNVGGRPNLLLVFGLTGVRAGKPAHAVGANLTIIEQGTSHIYGTLGDTRCTVDSLTQRPLALSGSYRVEARGFCTSPAHAIRGDGDILVSTFEFAGIVNYPGEQK